MKINSILVRNFSWGWIAYVYNIVLMLWITPIVIQSIGLEAYGVWVVLQSVVGYYGFVDMGFRAALAQTITRNIARGEYEQVVRFIGSALPFMAKLGLVVVLLSTIAAWLIPRLVEMDPSVAHSLWIVIILQACGIAIGLITQPFNGVTVGLQRYDIAEFVGMATRTIWAVSIVIALRFSGNLLTFVSVSLAVTLLEAFVRVQRAVYLLPELKNVKWKYRSDDLKELYGKGSWNFVIQISRQVLNMSSPLIVGILFSARSVVPFALGSSLVDYGTKLIYQPTRMLYPTMVHLVCQDRMDELRSLFSNCVRFFTSIAIAYAVAAVYWCEQFLKLWLGDKEEYQYVFESAPWIVGVLSIRLVTMTFLETGNQLLLARDELKYLAKLSLLEALPSLLLSIAIGFYFGPIGVAIGCLLPMLILAVLFYIPRFIDLLGIRTYDFIIEVCAPLAAFGGMFLFAMHLYSRMAISPGNLFQFLLITAIPSSLMYLFLLPLVVDRKLIFTFLAKISGWFKRYGQA